MTSLHVYYALKQFDGFKRQLEGSRGQSSAATGSSSSGGRSWNRPSVMTMAAMSADVNARDRFGRTVLHLACSATDPASLEYARLLLAHPAINVNLLDAENHWTALHRALYYGNLAAANLLLQRMDTDTTLTDYEGYRAFDLYNTTVEGTKPPRESSTGRTELYTWGANRNAALGVGDADDRTYAEHVPLKRSDRGVSSNHMESLNFRLQPASVRSVSMSKLHTVVVTDEPRGNVRTCGFASTGRLGPVKGQHTQFALLPIQSLDQTIVSVSTGQDHTLALTDTGVIYSWGLNRFSQLGYTVEVTVGTRVDDPIQPTPRAITGPLKKEIVLGVAACKTASACWTETSVYTWGKNGGQLGYDKVAQPIQAVPRLVTRVNKPVTMLSMTDTAMACLLVTKDVVLLYNDGHSRINFPAQGFPSEIQAYRPPQAINNASIAKVVSLDNLFAAISSNGEIFTFSPPMDGEAGSGKDKGIIKPQRVWALRKQWSAVRDAALGSDGSLIVCTESGHVFVRTRNPRGQSAALKSSTSTKSFKFQRVPYIQRAVGVLANDTGAMAALRMEFRPQPVQIAGNSIAQDLLAIRPWLQYRRVGAEDGKRVEPSVRPPAPEAASPTQPLSPDEEDDSAEDAAVEGDAQAVLELWDVLVQDKLSRQRYAGRGLFERGDAPAHGADLLVRVQSGAEIPVHRAILAARCPALAALLAGGKGLLDRDSNMSVKLRLPTDTKELPRLVVSGGHALAVLIVLHYLYSDQLLAVWDTRVVRRVQAPLALGGLQPMQIVRDLQGLARVLALAHLDDMLRAATKRAPPPTLVRDLTALFRADQGAASGVRPDVVLRLADREVRAHSVVLRARTTFFASFFDMEEWTAERWAEDGTVTVDLAHLRWREMEYVLRFMCCGEEGEMFEKLEFIESVDGLLDFMFDVMSAANELLLDRLLLICSDILLKYVNLNNVCSVLADATYLHCLPLIENLHRYLAVNMETLLESRLLDDLTPRLIKDLSRDVRLLQLEKSPVSRSHRLVDEAMHKNEGWLAEQDIPHPIVPRAANKNSPRLSPKRARRPSIPPSPLTSPTVRPNLSTRASQLTLSGDDLFVMDDVPALNLDTPGGDASVVDSVLKGSPWRKTTSAPKVDMKSILAEAEGGKLAASGPSSLPKQPSRDRIQTQSTNTPVQRPSGSPAISRQGSSGPWRSQTAAPIAATASPAQRAEFPAVGVPSAPATPRVKPVQSSPSVSRQSASTSAQPPQPHPGLGPVITPAKQSPSKNGTPPTRRVASAGSVWTLPPVQPIVQSSGPTPSFVAIQHAQEQQDSASTKDVRSLKEIQAEEQSRREEEAFLQWWAAEEERIRLEGSGVAAVPAKPQRPQRAKKTKAGSKSKAKSTAETEKEKAASAPADGQNGPRKPRPSRNRKAPSNSPTNNNTL